MSNTFQLKINQCGEVNCKICGNHINWHCKVEGMWMPNGKMATSIESKPYQLVMPILTGDGKVKFRIGCEQCTFSIETDPMELIKNVDSKE